MDCTFDILSKKPLHKTISQNLSSILSHRNCTVSGFTFWSIIYLELIFGYGEKSGLKVFALHMAIQFFPPTPFIAEYPFNIGWSKHLPLKKKKRPYMCTSIFELSNLCFFLFFQLYLEKQIIWSVPTPSSTL